MDFFDFDDDYVRRLREGDRETGEHFERYFRELLLAMLRRRLGSHADAKDALQKTFLRTFEKLPQLRDARRLGSFVLGIARNVVLEHYRDRGRTVPLDEKWEGQSNDDSYQRLHILFLQALVRQILVDMDKDTPKEAAVLRAVYIDEEDKDEVCRRHGITRDYLRVVLHRAKEKFRAVLKRLDGN
jgi:RNA polymerase sigma-70 factor (ECF subfamily)